MGSTSERNDVKSAYGNSLNGVGMKSNLGGDDHPQNNPSQKHKDYLLVVDPRTLDRECFIKTLLDCSLRMQVTATGSVDEWRKRAHRDLPLGAILLNLGGKTITDPGVADQISRTAAEFKSIPVVIVADTDELGQVLTALECGARGYIPTSVGVDVCVEAIGLAVAGGIFVPATSVLAMRHLINAGSSEAMTLARMFTARQAEVAKALRCGKANKAIAHELNLRESTVKVHIRNIMRKLKAANRTEVAYKINDLLPAERHSFAG
jgi:DNA-binding NarL/FixJ family response regulator